MLWKENGKCTFVWCEAQHKILNESIKKYKTKKKHRIINWELPVNRKDWNQHFQLYEWNLMGIFVIMWLYGHQKWTFLNRCIRVGWRSHSFTFLSIFGQWAVIEMSFILSSCFFCPAAEKCLFKELLFER